MRLLVPFALLTLASPLAGCSMESSAEGDQKPIAELSQAASTESWDSPTIYPVGANPNFDNPAFYHQMGFVLPAPGITVGNAARAGEKCNYYVGGGWDNPIYFKTRLVLDCTNNGFTSCVSVCGKSIAPAQKFAAGTVTWYDAKFYPRATNPYLASGFVHEMVSSHDLYGSLARVGEKCRSDLDPNNVGVMIYWCAVPTDINTCLSRCSPLPR